MAIKKPAPKVTKPKKNTKRSKIKRVCMLTVHGYVDPKPILGKTDTGGQVVYVLELAKAMAKTGIKVDIYTRQFQKRKSIERVARNVRIIRIPCGGQKFIHKEHLLPHLDTFVNNMARFMKKKGLEYDVFHSHYWDAGYVAMKISEHYGTFFVHTFHSLGAWKRENMGGDAKKMEKMFRFKERIKNEKVQFKKAASIIMTSTAMIKSAKEFYKYKRKDHIVVPAGVNTEIFRPLKRGEKNKPIDVPNNYIFWVGRFDTNKGLDYLLRGFSEVLPKAKDLFLVIGGGSKNPKPREESLRKELKRIIKKYELTHRVFFTRHIKDKYMPSYYRQAKMFVLPSKFEPFGMTAAEAMACETPLIVSKRSGIGKFLKNGTDCMIVNASNKKDLGWAFRIMNRNGTFRNKVAKNGLKVAREQFSWTHIASKSLAHYEKIIEDWNKN